MRAPAPSRSHARRRSTLGPRIAEWCRANPRALALFAALALANAGAWIWAMVVFRHYPVALGTALLAYGLGLRHAIDADHIAAIDNVTRKLMHDGARPHAAGFFFSLGHSTIVVLASVAIAAAAGGAAGPLAWIRDVGGSVGTMISAAFLGLIAIINLVVLVSVHRMLRGARRGETLPRATLDATLAGGGLLARLLRPVFRVISRSWHMYPLGFLFGLGFDTASEIGLLGISAAEASRGMPMWSIMVFPVLFTAGMSLLDTADSMLMVGAYGWAFTNPVRKLHYNVAITLTSVLVALFVGGIEVLGLVGRRAGGAGGFWTGVATLNANAGRMGVSVVLLLLAAWAGAALLYRRRDAATLDLAGD
jgi:high-affinity nickel-transport protein